MRDREMKSKPPPKLLLVGVNWQLGNLMSQIAPSQGLTRQFFRNHFITLFFVILTLSFAFQLS